MVEPDSKKGKINSYLNRDPLNFIKDGEPRALYWKPYRNKYEKLKEKLNPGEEIKEGEICLMGFNNLKPDDFHLRKKDRAPAGIVTDSGKSAHIKFTDDPHIVAGAIMDRDLRRQDAVYFADVSEVKNAGWSVVYAPLENQPLHTRLVPDRLVGDKLSPQPPLELRSRLAEIFSRKKIRKSSA
jgi:hypothetical protein